MSSRGTSTFFDLFENAMQQCAPFEAAPIVAVACSGGADSLALTLLAQDWAKARGGKAIALTVDHGLRDESAQEAAQLGAWLAARDIKHHILTLHKGEINPSRGMQEQARAARYAALEHFCKDHHIMHLLLGHHAGDQAETLAFRAMRGSGFRGLSGMAMVREGRDCRMLRPLLAADKQQCVAYLDAQHQPYINDPSNINPAFSRVTIRAALSETPALHASLTDAAHAIGQARFSQDSLIAHHLARCVSLNPAGVAQMNWAYYSALAAPLQMSLLQQVVMCVGGHQTPPRGEKLQSLRTRLAQETKLTAMGCVVERDKSVTFFREPAAADRAGAVALEEGARWDGRYMWRGNAMEDVTIRALGEAGLAACKPHLTKQQLAMLKSLPHAARLSLPALWHLDSWLGVPYIGAWNNKMKCPKGMLAFAPHNPLAGHGFCAMVRSE